MDRDIIPVSYTHLQYNLDLIDGKDVEFGQIFSKASMFGKAFWLRLRMGIFTFLWTLLLIIPGIIKSYAYSMSGFILAENSEMTAKEAMKVSEKMMAGNKWRLFCLQFSFIGWQLLCILSLGIGFLWLTPYMNAATAAFYDEISREPLNLSLIHISILENEEPVYVDFETQERIPKDSALWYKEVIKTNGECLSINDDRRV